MHVNLDPRIATAIAEILEEALSRGNEVSAPGFGTFRIAQHPAEFVRQRDGTVSIRPPRREVEFEFES